MSKGIDFGALANFQKDLENSGTMFLYQKNLPQELDVRVLPPTEGMSFYFVKENVYWIAGKRYISPSTFGEPCPIEEEIAEARALRDPAINKLLSDSKNFTFREEYSIPILELECVFDKGVVTKVKPVGKPKILKCTKQLVGAINRIAINRKYQNGTANGFCDLTEGFNITLIRENVNGKVSYDAEAHRDPYAIDPSWVVEQPDIVKNIEEHLVSDDELREAIRGYLYGASSRSRRSDVEYTAPTRTRVSKTAVDDEIEAPAPTRTRKVEPVETIDTVNDTLDDVERPKRMSLADRLNHR